MPERPSLVPLFSRALEAEIEAIKRGKAASSVRLIDGRIRAVVGGQHVYAFHLESWLSVVDDTPAEIEVRGEQHPCHVVSTRGLEVEVALEQSIGDYVPAAVLQTSAWYLLELLRKALNEADFSTEGASGVAEELFAGASYGIDAPMSSAHYSLWPAPPNPSQRAAIEGSLGRSLMLVWGPPGTGKTKTIAKATEAHLNGGRRVLLVSHANAAVDAALADVAEQMRATDLYSQGQLVRVGVCRDDALARDYPLVIPDEIVKVLGRPLVEEQTALRTRLRDIATELQRHEAIVAVETQLRSAADIRDAAQRAVQGKSVELEALNRELAAAEAELERVRQKHLEAQQAGLLRRLVTGLDPTAIALTLDRLQREMEPRARFASELQRWCADTRRHIGEQALVVGRLESELQGKLAEAGLSLPDLLSARRAVEERRKRTESRLAEIEAQLQALRGSLVSRARLVATTLTQTFTAKDLVDARFDVIIVDESSMAPLPHVYWAATKARLSATLVGDFAQLPPICVSDDEAAQAWLGRNIYALLGMDSLDLARADDRVCLLGTQYRMAPAIAELPNGLFYGGLLNHAPYTQSLVGGDPVLGPSSVTLVDIAGGRPWCSRILPRGRFNLYAAFVSACIARRIADATDWTVGVISPYKAQARLVDRIVKDWGLGDRIKASTVHTFQGGEEDAIILDCVESPGSGRWSMLDDGRNGASARQLLNVALTRARRKLVLVAHADYLERTFPQASALLAALRYCGEAGSVVRAEDLVSGYVAAGVDGLVEPAPALAGSPLVEGRLHTERDFWPAFVADLRGAERSVTIMSPFISLRRAGGLIEPLDQLRRKGVEVRCYTRPPSRQTGAMAEHAEEVIHQLEDLGVTVVQRTNMHQKVAVIDENVVWEGSLNILSHGHTEEQMRRLEGQNTAREVARNLRLSEEPSAGDVVQTPCPECGKPMVVRRGRFGEFLGCTGYPACQGKAPWRASRAKGTQAAPSPDAPRPDVAAEPSLGRPRQDKAPSPKRKAAAAKTSGSSGASTRCPKCGRRLVRRSGLHGPFLGCSGFPSCRYTRNARGHGRT